ncbi:hypothetical protein JRO89_XS04G0081800 [Xanthoceras sorbifolium]|uniref:B box-type domain-containing protein n=1 Tax=Xanthoceras sorbifolium TaxID=99658 RepID=A0ABQ8I4M4_9ROSI|nr:hypothetical protein JRO89_XS04G0081800 [Xanthoceras sorbifolium]
MPLKREEEEEMRIQCNGCELAEAKVLCCANEVALCWDCDERIHAASQHQRVPLCHSSFQMPKCDICQETIGYFFCLEDRALLCGKCDVAIHTANSYVAGHQRLLLTGVKVGLESAEPSVSSTIDKLNLIEKASEIMSSQSFFERAARIPNASDATGMSRGQIGGVVNVIANKVPFPGGTAVGNIPECHLEEYLGSTEFSQNYAAMYNVSSSKIYMP